MAFRLLKEELPGVRLPHIMSDYEKGLLAALRESFPDSILSGCLFHCDQVRVCIDVLDFPLSSPLRPFDRVDCAPSLG